MAWRAETPCGAFGLGHCGWNGKLAAVTNANGFVTAYAYDVMDRLASDGGVTYTYDAAGNRMTKTENGEAVIYTLGEGDRLASYGRARSPSAPQLVDVCGVYSYDAAGNVTQIVRDGSPTLDLVWNGQYQLVSVSTNGVFAEGYAYDALGRRAATTTREGTTRHVYDDNWQVVADIDGEGNVLASYVWGEGIDRLLAVKIGGESYYPLTDIQGTVWGYVNSQNNIVARWQYDAWGNVVEESVSVPALATLRYRFQGREWSAATGLTNFRMRWYDSVTGRWLSKDPIGLSGGLNLYAFCGNNPICRIDVYGTLSWDEAMAYASGFVDGFVEAVKDGELKKGIAATVDGMIIGFDPFISVYSNGCGEYDDVYAVSQICGVSSDLIFMAAFLAPQGIEFGSQQVVTHFSTSTQTSLKAGDWVMTGGNTLRNKLMAGFRTARKESLTTTVPKSSLEWPSGWEWCKGFLGQRVYNGGF